MSAARLVIALLVGRATLVSGLFVPEPTTRNPLGTTRNDAASHKVYQPWDASPSDSEASNLIFFRLATLLQHWPNTRYPSGQSVVPGTIPAGTTLYRGQRIAEVPTTPEWLALDPEHSMQFIGSSDSRLLTFIATHPLRILYFDGSSGAKLSTGAADAQCLLAWGKTGNDPLGEEKQLINDLCEWGKDLSIDGYVRMEMSFEVMYCDFSQGLDLVSSIHLLPFKEYEPSTPLGPGPDGFPSLSDPVPQISILSPNEPRPPNWKGALPDEMSRMFEVFQAGAWHNRAPGEVRVKIDAARLVSLYDPALQSALAARRGKEKILHRGKGLTEDDISTWRDWVKHVAHKDAPPTSGVDWPALTTVIMDRYGGRLEYLEFLLHPDRVSRNATAAVQDVRSHLMVMLATDITADTVPPDNKAATSSMRLSQIRQEAQNHTWVEPIARRCSSFVVSHLPKSRFTREERTLHAAVSGTQAEICRVLALMWSEAYDPIGRAEGMLEEWRGRVDGLMRWLDWPMWNLCKPECSLDTMCFIPTWPMGVKGSKGLDEIDWTPKCIPRGEIYF